MEDASVDDAPSKTETEQMQAVKEESEESEKAYPNGEQAGTENENGSNSLPSQAKMVRFHKLRTSREQRPITSVEDCLREMKSGTDFVKIRGRHQFQRKYALDENAEYISWQPSRKRTTEARIPVRSIKEVRSGQCTESFARHSESFDKNNSLSLIYGADFQCLDLVAESTEKADMWITGLKCLLDGDFRSKVTDGRPLEVWVKKQFQEADKNGNGLVSESEFLALAKRLNIGLSSSKLKAKFKEFDADSAGSLKYDDFVLLYQELSTRPEIYHILMRYSKNWNFLSVEELRQFLLVEQEMPRATVDFCKELIHTHEPSEERKAKHQLSVEGFTQLLLSKPASVVNPSHCGLHQDMSQPLSHYYIASSHNTYLTADQLKSDSSVEMYVRALRMGCRCVELDCWDGDDDEPEIYHGHTLTSHILFKDVITAIEANAFVSSEYPVILSLENHCSVPAQRKMALYLKDILGDKLYCTLPDPSMTALPSPEFFKGKILIKGKKLKPEEEEAPCDEKGVDDDDDDDSEEDNGGQLSDSGDETDGKRKKRKKKKLAKELSDLVTHCQAVHFQSFAASAESGKPYQMSSFSEGKVLSLSSSSAEFIDYNKRQLSRVYPSGSRFSSSNYSPQIGWNLGCQIIALNYQTAGDEMDLNNGLFQINGACGYVLKPEVLRSDASFINLSNKDGIPGVLPLLMKIKVISGQRLPKPPDSAAKGEIIDPFVVIDVHGIPQDNYRGKTKTVNNNGFNPMWNESFQYLLKFPEVAMLRFAVLDDDFVGDDFIGQFSLPVASIQPGYRHIPLLSKKGDTLQGATIFIHIQFEKPLSLQGSLFDFKTAAKSIQKLERKVVNISDIDLMFLNVMATLKESATIRVLLHSSIDSFKKSCGLSSSATVHDAIRAFLVQVKDSCLGEFLEKDSDTLKVKQSVKETAPRRLQPVFTKLEEMLSRCQTVVLNSEAMMLKVNETYEAGEKRSTCLLEELAKQGIKGKEAAKAKEAFCWNMQTMKGYVQLMNSAKDLAAFALCRVEDAAETEGLCHKSL